MKIVTLAQYCMRGEGHDLSYHEALHGLQGGEIREVVTYLPKSHVISGLSQAWKRFFVTPLCRCSMFPLRFFDYIRMYRLSSDPTLFFLETFNTQDFIAFFISTMGFSAKNHHIYILYRDGKQGQYFKKLLQQSISQCLAWRLGSRYVSLTDSELVAKVMKQAIVLPIPHVEAEAPPLSETAPFIIWFPGAPRAEKGIKWIQYLASRSCDDEIILLVSEEAKIEKQQLNVEFLNGLMTREKYIDTLYRSHALLLPYEPQFYQSRTSGPFVEAIVAGRWVFTTKGTWMAYELLRFDLEELIVDWKSPFILNHIKSVIKDPPIQKKWRRMIENYRQFHSKKSFECRLKQIVSNSRREYTQARIY